MLFEVFADGDNAASFCCVVSSEHEHASAFDRFVILMVLAFAGDVAVQLLFHGLADDVPRAAGDQSDPLYVAVADHFHRRAQLLFEGLAQLLG